MAAKKPTGVGVITTGQYYPPIRAMVATGAGGENAIRRAANDAGVNLVDVEKVSGKSTYLVRAESFGIDEGVRKLSDFASKLNISTWVIADDGPPPKNLV